DRVIERQRDVATLDLGTVVDDVDDSTGGILDERLMPRFARKLPVELEFEPCETVVVDTHVAEHLCGNRVLRVRAPLLRQKTESRDLLPRKLSGTCRIRLTRDVDEPA